MKPACAVRLTIKGQGASVSISTTSDISVIRIGMSGRGEPLVTGRRRPTFIAGLKSPEEPPRNDRDGAGAARAYCDLEASYDHAVNGRSATSVGQSRLTRPTWSARRVCAGSRWADQLGLRKAKMTKGMATWCRAPSIVGERHLLRVVQRRARRHAEAPRVVGVDDWVFRRNNRYGTLICDLDRCGL
jgi:hypothetical protein